MLPRVTNAIDRISTTIGTIGAWLILPLIVSMVWEVGARFLFGVPTFWAYEISYMASGTSYLFGMALCAQKDAHVRVDFFYASRSAKTRALIDVFGYAIVLLPPTLWLVFGLFDYTQRAFTRAEVSGVSAWNPVVWPFRLMWVIAFAALAAQGVSELLKNLKIVFGTKPGADENEI